MTGRVDDSLFLLAAYKPLRRTGESVVHRQHAAGNTRLRQKKRNRSRERSGVRTTA
ncbi:MAG: hypothetical protein GY921_06315 [Phycisphaeraceae bacterium]|nr:hypothetical protein [Phycisphaeraceae bacterium]